MMNDKREQACHTNIRACKRNTQQSIHLEQPVNVGINVETRAIYAVSFGTSNLGIAYFGIFPLVFVVRFQGIYDGSSRHWKFCAGGRGTGTSGTSIPRKGSVGIIKGMPWQMEFVVRRKSGFSELHLYQEGNSNE